MSDARSLGQTALRGERGQPFAEIGRVECVKCTLCQLGHWNPALPRIVFFCILARSDFLTSEVTSGSYVLWLPAGFYCFWSFWQ